MTSTTLEFPEGFVWGTATAAFQIEGAATEDREPSIWDRFCSVPGNVVNNDTGDIACDHYHRFEEDVETLLKQLNTKYYRFSIAWPRLQTWGADDSEPVANEKGIAFYNRLINCLVAHGIEPVVTLYHWDLPTAVQDRYDGWAGNSGIAKAFTTYAGLCFERFGDRVKWWITLNEPWCSAYMAYEKGEHAPGITTHPGVDVYKAGHNLLLAHAYAVALYREKFQAEQDGRIGITMNTAWFEPAIKDDAECVRASRRAMSFELGWFADPVYKGDYPDVMREVVGDRLPRFTAAEQELLKGSSDFFGLNHYTTTCTRGVRQACNTGEVGYDVDKATDDFQKEEWGRSDMGWPIVAQGFTRLLEYVHTEYRPAGGIVVTENGVALADVTAQVAMADGARVQFYREYIGAMHAAMTGSVKADVRGYFLWSLMDNFEWASGYQKRFGLFFVDYETQERVAKPAVQWYADVIAKNAVVVPS